MKSRSCIVLCLCALFFFSASIAAQDTLMFHHNREHWGWNKDEPMLAPDKVRNHGFTKVWESKQFDVTPDHVPPHVYNTVLYAHDIPINATTSGIKGTFDVAFATTNNNDVYAINAKRKGSLAAGALLWKVHLGRPVLIPTSSLLEGPVYMGVLGAPFIERGSSRMYVAACVCTNAPICDTAPDPTNSQWEVYALDTESGVTVSGWPIAITNSALNASGVNKNGGSGAAGFEDVLRASQRGALTASRDGTRLYVPFGGYNDQAVGWLVAIDTKTHSILSAFSSGQTSHATVNGGLWGTGGAVVDTEPNSKNDIVYITTGNSQYPALQTTPHNWGESVLKLDKDLSALKDTYTPVNYPALDKEDIDLGGGSAISVTLASSDAHRVLVFGGKEGSIYLLDALHMPGTTFSRTDIKAETSFLPPPGPPGPITFSPILNVFGPDSTAEGNVDHAKMRTTPSYFSDGATDFVFVSGTSKEACTASTTDPSYSCATPLPVTPPNPQEPSEHSIAPSIVRVKIKLSGGTRSDRLGAAMPGTWPYLSKDAANPNLVFLSPSSPEISSNGGHDAIVWVYASNVGRGQSLSAITSPPFALPSTPAPPPRGILYAMDAQDSRLTLLWNSADPWNTEIGRSTDLPQLCPRLSSFSMTTCGVGGKYGNAPTIALGQVLIGTDRVEAFGLPEIEPHVLFPAQNAYVDESHPAQNFAGAKTLLVQASTSPAVARNAYLRFHLAKEQKISRAILRFCGNVNADTFAKQQQLQIDVYEAKNTPSWTETAITWNNQPGLGTLLSKSPTNIQGTSNIWYEMDVTDYVRKRKAEGRDADFVLHGVSNTTANFIDINSKENPVNGPQLVITPAI